MDPSKQIKEKWLAGQLEDSEFFIICELDMEVCEPDEIGFGKCGDLVNECLHARFHEQ